MTVFTVHQPLPRKTEDVAPPERFAFVRDGFYFWAFLLGPLWMFWNGLWLVLLIYLVGTAAIQAALWALGVSAAVKFAVGTPDRHSGRMRSRIAAALEPAPPLDQRRPGGRAQSGDGGAPLFRVVVGRCSIAAAGRCAGSSVHADAGAFARRHRPVPRAASASMIRRPPMSVAIVDYGSGNLHSAAKAFERAARESGHDQPIVVTRDPDEVRRAERVVLPGVGAFADCRHGLDAVPGMVEALEETVRGKGRPFLGICVGMQLMAERGREYVVTDGLGWIRGEVDKIAPSDAA